MKIDGTRRNDRATEVVLAYYAAFNRGDWAGMLALLDEQVVHDLNQGPREVGREAFAAFLESHGGQLSRTVARHRRDGFARRASRRRRVRGAGRISRQRRGMPPARGQKYVLPGGAFFTIRNGRIQRVTNYYNLEEWISQVG